jgi:serine/threonine-protein kinase
MPPTFTDEGLQAARAIRERHRSVGVLVLSQELAPRQALRLLDGSARGVGYLLKDRVADLDEFAEAVRRVGRGGSAVDPELVARLLDRGAGDDRLTTLTVREREILALMAEGRSNRAIGASLFLGVKTIETHISTLFAKLDLPPAPDDHRRVLAVLVHLRSR